jgi:hypothetical protein
MNVIKASDDIKFFTVGSEDGVIIFWSLEYGKLMAKMEEAHDGIQHTLILLKKVPFASCFQFQDPMINYVLRLMLATV